MEVAAALAFAAAVVWDIARRWINHRSVALAKTERMDALEAQVIGFTTNLDAALTEHKGQHEAAIKNLVAEMRTELDELRTKAGIAAANATQRPRRVARIR